MTHLLSRLAKGLGVIALVALAAAALRRLLGGQAMPAPAPRPDAPRPPLTVVEEVDSPEGAEPHVVVHSIEEDAVPDDSGVHEARADDDTGEAAGWVEPVDGTCPITHPVKVKTSSGIFHVPGGANYHRTSPDRCYPSAEAAVADGYRAAKR